MAFFLSAPLVKHWPLLGHPSKMCLGPPLISGRTEAHSVGSLEDNLEGVELHCIADFLFYVSFYLFYVSLFPDDFIDGSNVI